MTRMYGGPPSGTKTVAGVAAMSSGAKKPQMKTNIVNGITGLPSKTKTPTSVKRKLKMHRGAH